MMPASSNPMTLLEDSRRRAKVQGDPNAALCALATVGADGQPGVRMMIVQAVVDRAIGMVFTDSHLKWQQLQETGRYEILVWLPSLMHQYRISGIFEEMERQAVAKFWLQKPRQHRLMDLFESEVYAPGTPISSQAQFLEAVETLTAQSPNLSESASLPEHLIGAWFIAQAVDVLWASPDRLGERWRFQFEGETWQQTLVIP